MFGIVLVHSDSGGNRSYDLIMSSRFHHSIRVVALALLSVILSWLLMQILHEAGHILHAWFSGGNINKVVLHPLSISRTDVDPNPQPLFVVWGGPIWGCLLPLLFWGVSKYRKSKIEHLLRFFAGVCLIANGAYLGIGTFHAVGDADVMLQHGTPNWLLAFFGLIPIPDGLWCWNGIGKEFGIGKSGEAPPTRTLLTLSLLLIAIILLELTLSEAV